MRQWKPNSKMIDQVDHNVKYKLCKNSNRQRIYTLKWKTQLPASYRKYTLNKRQKWLKVKGWKYTVLTLTKKIWMTIIARVLTEIMKFTYKRANLTREHNSLNCPCTLTDLQKYIDRTEGGKRERQFRDLLSLWIIGRINRQEISEITKT